MMNAGNIVTEGTIYTRISFRDLMKATPQEINSIYLKMKRSKTNFKRSQLMEQSVRTQRHITLDEIGRRIV
jgi:GrpB-like predicted nucleotidyltransferase (UPF0157 family)